MKVICKYNTGKDLSLYENKSLVNREFGRFGASNRTEYGELDIGKEYLVMGIIVFEIYQGYLIDGGGIISVCPCQLFEVIDDKIPINWKFRTIDKNEFIYPFIQAIIGYPELCTNRTAYEDLIVDIKVEAKKVFFKRKTELENSLT